MKYVGSKRRIAKYILPLILKNRKEGQVFYDLFCGGCNLIDKVNNPRVANDSNIYLIEFLKSLQINDIYFHEVSEGEYNYAKDNKHLLNRAYVGYIGFCSFGAKFFGGYCRDSAKKRNYSKEYINNLKKQQPLLTEIQFYNLDYKDVPLEPNSLIYLDPPYRNTTKYQNELDYDEFYSWIIEKHKEGHEIYISEYWMPDQFKCIWEKEVCSSLDLNTGGKKNIERLYTI